MIRDVLLKTVNTVGGLMDYLGQFNREVPLRATAEPDAVREDGYQFIWVDATFAGDDEGEDFDPDEDVDLSKVVRVELTVDH